MTKNKIDKKKIKKFLSAEKHLISNFEFNQDSINNSGEWPLTIKVVVTLSIAILLSIASYQILFKSNSTKFEKLIKEERTLTDEVFKKIDLSSGIEKYTGKIENMNASFNNLLSNLPTDIEMDGLLNDITQKGVKNGIEFKKFELLPEIASEFYVEQPIDMIIIGDYHALANFISDVSNLKRIVTFHEFELVNKDNNKDAESKLEMKITVKTYKYEYNEKV